MKNIQSLIIILLLVFMIGSVDQVSATITSKSDMEAGGPANNELNAVETSEVAFPHDRVVDVNIEIDADDYLEMMNNAMNEEYVLADITYDGYAFDNIAIRPKGNSSLKEVAQSGGDRFSFKIDFDKYVDGQNLFGMTKLNLNNLFKDPTLMAEYLGYEMLDAIGAAGSDTTYAAVSINGEYFGLYLAVEAVDENFLMKNYGNYDGALYKPDMGIGADLAYISDEPDDYAGVTPQDDKMTTDQMFVDLVTVVDKIIENGGESEAYRLSDVMNVDSFLQYLAFSTSVIHLDSYQSGMFHNYYLYFNTETKVFEWITWDLNMIFNGFPMSNLTDEEAVLFLIDEPVMGAMSQYPLIEAVFTNESYVATYHDYIQRLTKGYLSEATFEEKVLAVYSMIEPYASVDPSAFYTITSVKENVFDNEKNDIMSVTEFVECRVNNMEEQLAGERSSTNNGNGNQCSGGRNEKTDRAPQDTRNLGGPGGKKGNRPDEMQTDTSTIPPETLDLQEQDLLPEAVNADMEPGEMPPPDAVPQLVGEVGMEISTQTARVVRKGALGSEAQPPGFETEKTIQEVATVGVSIALSVAFAIYLAKRKY